MKKIYSVILMFFSLCICIANTINVKDYGAKGDGVSDDRIVIQKVIDELILNGGGTVYFPNGNYAIYNQSLLIWGDNIILLGEDKDLVTIVKRGSAGQYGTCIDILGKIKNFYYFGDFAKGDYKVRTQYHGTTEKANNILLKNLSIKTNLATYNKLANNIGIVNSKNVTIENCVFSDAPQSNVAIVNDKRYHSNGDVKFLNCIFKNSGAHNVRVISYNNGEYDGNFVTFKNCSFLNVKGKDPQVRDLTLLDYKVHLWYRGSSTSGKTSVLVDKCFFDSTGIVYNNVNPNMLSIIDSKLNGGLIIKAEERFDDNPKIVVKNNTIKLLESQNRLKDKKKSNIKKEVFSGNLKISNSENIEFLNNVYK